MRVVAIDQGTTSTRAFVLHQDGAGRIVCARKHRQIHPNPGWVEHDPEELFRHVAECLEAAGPVDAIGIDNQGESCLAWDGDTGGAISPVIVWQDRRTERAIDDLKAAGAEELTLARCGLPLDPYFSASKLAWILDNVPAARDLLTKGRLRLGTTDAFFLDRLTGNFATDVATASRTSLFNLETRQWDPELCSLFGVPIEALPEIKPTMGHFGTVNLAGGRCPLTASVVDQQASLYGHGCRRPGDTKITFGTGAFALAITGENLMPAPDRGLLPTIAWQPAGGDPTYALDAGIYCAGSAIDWANSLGLFTEFSEINAFAVPPVIGRNLAFVPALTGLGCPYWDGSAAGLWIGISLGTSARDMVQAILEGVAFRAAQLIDALGEQLSIGEEISIDGGMSSNPYFCQFLCNVLQRRIVAQTMGELTVLGTAMMAMGASSSVSDNGVARHRNYQPTASHEDGKARFAEAVSRCRGWLS